MATNFYFNNFRSSQEQQLIEDLVIESIKIYGIDSYYLPRNILNRNEVFREQDSADFDSSFGIELYIKNIDGFGGDGKFLSKFGLEMRDEIVFTMAMKSFNNYVTAVNGQNRPKEGDVIYFPLANRVYQIKYVDQLAVFYQLGSLQMYDLTCELFEYSNEKFDTGIPEIDDKYATYSFDMSEYALLTSSGFELSTSDGDVIIQNYDLDAIDKQSQNDDFDAEASDIIDFSARDPFSEGST